MDKREKYTITALSVLVIGTLLMKAMRHPSMSPSSAMIPVDNSAQPSAQAQFDAPYLSTNPGISDDPVTLNGGAPFQSVINQTINPSYLGTLSQNFMPMFGFVGLGTQRAAAATSTMPPPPAPLPATFISAPPAPMPIVRTPAPPPAYVASPLAQAPYVQPLPFPSPMSSPPPPPAPAPYVFGSLPYGGHPPVPNRQ